MYYFKEESEKLVSEEDTKPVKKFDSVLALVLSL